MRKMSHRLKLQKKNRKKEVIKSRRKIEIERGKINDKTKIDE